LWGEGGIEFPTLFPPHLSFKTPHPNPLPVLRGEGAITSPILISPSPQPSPHFVGRGSNKVPNLFPPLPVKRGEGWGEGFYNANLNVF